MNNHLQQSHFQAGYGAPGAMPPQPGLYAHPWEAAPAGTNAHLS